MLRQNEGQYAGHEYELGFKMKILDDDDEIIDGGRDGIENDRTDDQNTADNNCHTRSLYDSVCRDCFRPVLSLFLLDYSRPIWYNYVLRIIPRGSAQL